MGEAALFDRGEPVAPPAIDFTEVKVEIGAFDDFIRLMQAELEQNLQPYSDQIIADHYQGTGTPIARHAPSSPLYEFQHQYGVTVDTAVAGLRSYVEATKVLVRAVELLAERYRGADSMAVASMQDVQGAMSLATQQIIAETPAPMTVTPI